MISNEKNLILKESDFVLTLFLYIFKPITKINYNKIVSIKDRERKIRMKKDYQVGDEIFVSGEVEYGDNYYRVSTRGVIEEVNEETVLATLDSVDGDFGVCVYVEKTDIEDYQEHLSHLNEF